MKQKVTIKMGIECESCRNKAMKIASTIKGVTAVAIEGDYKDLLVVTGEDVDTICLGIYLRKKFRIVTVLTVEEVKPQKADDQKPNKEKPKVATVGASLAASAAVTSASASASASASVSASAVATSHKCEGGCKACYRCSSYSCHGNCAAVICYGQCPPSFSCSFCSPYPPSAICYNVVYEQKPEDSCSIQ